MTRLTEPTNWFCYCYIEYDVCAVRLKMLVLAADHFRAGTWLYIYQLPLSPSPYIIVLIDDNTIVKAITKMLNLHTFCSYCIHANFVVRRNDMRD